MTTGRSVVNTSPATSRVIACMLRGVPPFLCLQVAEAAALLLLQQSWPDDTPAGAVSLPAAAALAQARLQQAAVCLQLAQADARHATADAAAKRPKYPRVPEKDAAVVEGYVDVEVQQVQEARKEQQEEVSHLTLTSPTPFRHCCIQQLLRSKWTATAAVVAGSHAQPSAGCRTECC